MSDDWHRFKDDYKAIRGAEPEKHIPADVLNKAHDDGMKAFNALAVDYVKPAGGQALSSQEQVAREQEVDSARQALPHIRNYLDEDKGAEVTNAARRHTRVARAKLPEGGYDMMLHSAYLDARLDSIKEQVPPVAQFEEYRRGKSSADKDTWAQKARESGSYSVER